MVVTRYGRREWLTATIIAGVLVASFAWLSWWWAVAPVLVPWLAVMLFFRDPPRRVPTDLPPQTMLSPADGRVSAVEEAPHHDAVGGPALVIRIFLSVLDVHVNRSPCDGVVLSTTHTRGRFHDARTAECAVENECQLTIVRMDLGPTVGVRQIAGKLARRIVCGVTAGDRLRRGGRFGMIKFGSSTELIIPRELVGQVHVAVGDRVHGGLNSLVTLSLSG